MRLAAVADLEGAQLAVAELKGADLSRTNLRHASLESAHLAGYKIAYTKSELAIGCEQHPIMEWWRFSDEVIADMDDGALDWWAANKDKIKRQIENLPAK